MTEEHYNHLSSQIHSWLDIEKIDLEEFKTFYKEKGLSTKRMRWDLLHRAKLTPWMCANLYPYLNKDNIDTALRRITNTK